MHQILNFTFFKDSIIKLHPLSDSDYKKIPLLNQIKYLANVIDKNGEVKLTSKGFLPTKLVLDLYQQGFLKDEHIELGISKLYKEADSMTINLTRILLKLTGLVKKRTGKISLTKASKKILNDDTKLLQLVFSTFAEKFNWAYYDGYEEEQIGQLGYGFTLILLSKYGQTKQFNSFYAEKYFKAFPHLLDSIEEQSYSTKEDYVTRCYSLRTFERFLDYFGLITIEKNGISMRDPTYITKTDLFDKLIKVRPSTAAS